MGGFALDTVGAYPDLVPEDRTILDHYSFASFLEFSTVEVNFLYNLDPLVRALLHPKINMRIGRMNLRGHIWQK
jgi:hypothetical protein